MVTALIKQREDYKPLILVVDDDQDNLLFASYIVELLGMNCIVSDDSRETLFLVKKLLPDLILLDIVMPSLSGIDIAHQIKLDKNVNHIPIIAVTGLTRKQEKTQIINAGFNDYLCKPYLIEELQAKIYSILKSCLV
ncbi:MAG: response regulator [Xenococcaceae cyanobacterium MO_167.B52]|nr:response regulator [Xenococcaceae cyanobacterium MO_167.B52]